MKKTRTPFHPGRWGVRLCLASGVALAVGLAQAANPGVRKPEDPPEIEIKGSRFSLPPEGAPDRGLPPALEHPPAFEQPLAKRLPLPDTAARAGTLATVREVYKAEMDKAKTPAELIAVAEKLMNTAGDTKDDPVARFVLWQLALELATKAGEPTAAFAALDEIARNFEIDELTVKSRTLTNLAPKTNAKSLRDVLAAASDIIARAVAADRYDLAKTVSDEAATLAQKFGDAALRKEITAQRMEIGRLEKAYADVPAANKTLQTNATDPASNLIVGTYQIEKGNWEAALPCLALSGDSPYKDLAAKELAQPEDAAAQIALADGWWGLAQQTKDELLNSALSIRAYQWYSKPLPQLTGLTRTKAEKRIGELAPLVAKGGLATFDAKTMGKPDGPAAKHPAAPAAKSSLVIVAARWGIGSNWIDVTQIAQEGVAKGEAVQASNDYFKFDPSVGQGKQLQIIFEKGGRRATASINEGGSFRLSDYD